LGVEKKKKGTKVQGKKLSNGKNSTVGGEGGNSAPTGRMQQTFEGLETVYDGVMGKTVRGKLVRESEPKFCLERKPAKAWGKKTQKKGKERLLETQAKGVEKRCIRIPALVKEGLHPRRKGIVHSGRKKKKRF